MTQREPTTLATHSLGTSGKKGFFTTGNARGTQTSDGMAHV
jgi:hypothetical protein